MSNEYIIDVKRVKNSDDIDEWSGKINGKIFKALNEETLREDIRLYLLDIVSKETNKDINNLKATLKRTWRVRIIDNENISDIDSIFD